MTKSLNRRKPLGILGISLQNLKHQYMRSLFMIFFILLLSSSFFLSSLLMESMEKGIILAKQRMGADMIVVPKEYTKELHETMFTGNPCTIYFNREWVEKISGLEGVKKVSPQLYLATLGAGCCDVVSQLIAYDPNTDFVVRPWLDRTKQNLVLRTGEVVIGSSLIPKPGDNINFYNTQFKVVAKMEETGMTYDNSVFINYDTAKMLLDSPEARSNLKLDNFDNLISMVLVNGKDNITPDQLNRNFSYKFYDDPISAVTANSLVSDVSQNIRKFSSYSRLLISFLLIMTIMSLICIFTITINERKREFGILCSIGATRKQMVLIIVLEALLISILGGTIGIAFSWSIMFLFEDLIRLRMGVPYMDVNIMTCIPIAVKCLLISILTGLVSSAFSVYKISHENPYELIRENE